MNTGGEESNPRFNKKLLRIPLLSSATANDDIDTIQGELTVPSVHPKPIALLIFAHGSGSGMDSPRNQHVAKVLNENGYATLLSDLLTPVETFCGCCNSLLSVQRFIINIDCRSGGNQEDFQMGHKKFLHSGFLLAPVTKETYFG